MAFPKELKPDPIIRSTVEIRFKSENEPSSINSKVYKTFCDDLPNLRPARFLDKIPITEYLPELVIHNDQYIIAAGKNVLSFENHGKYSLWPNYFKFISNSLAKFYSLGIVSEIVRIGVRYGSIFENISDSSIVLKQVPTLGISEFKESLNMVRYEMNGEFNSANVQIFNQGQIEKNNTKRTGFIIDLDIYKNDFPKNLSCNDVLELIDELHFIEKQMFFGLVKESFINTLDPTY